MKYLQEKRDENENSLWKNIGYALDKNLLLGDASWEMKRFIYNAYKETGEALSLNELRRIVRQQHGCFRPLRARDALNNIDDFYRTYVIFASKTLKEDSKKICEEGKKQLQTVFQFGGKGEIVKEKNEIYRDQALMTLNQVKHMPGTTYENMIHDLPEQYKNKVNVILNDISDSLAENLEEQEKLQESVKKIDAARLKERQRMGWIKSAIIIGLLGLVGWNLFGSSEDKDNHDTQDGEETKTEVITTEANNENTIKELER